jgi:soluble cytochrome b562
MNYQEIQEEIERMRRVNRQILESADTLLKGMKRNQENMKDLRRSIIELNLKLDFIGSQLGISMGEDE